MNRIATALLQCGRDFTLTVTLAGLVINPTLANPLGAQVVAGDAAMHAAGDTLSVTNAPGTIINWQSFSIAQNEITRFVQQNVHSAVLNRVTGQQLSQVLGKLESNGQIFLINPNGIVIGNHAVIDTAGFVASTLNMTDADFLAGRLAFGDADAVASGPADNGADSGADNRKAGAIRNGGVVIAREGPAIIVAPVIENSGLIRADNGDLILAAGRKVLVTDATLQGVTFEVQAPSDSIVNLGQIIARGGSIGAFAATLRSAGEITANRVTVGRGGEIVLSASGDTTLAAGSVTSASGAIGGKVDVRSGATTWVAGNVNADGVSGRGGVVDILGLQAGVVGAAQITANGTTGGGAIHLGGSLRGNGPLPNANAIFLGTGATLSACATQSGDGGSVVLWSNDSTQGLGHIDARGATGKGGFVETSSHGVLNQLTAPDVSALSGIGGEWLLDPSELAIVAGSGTANIFESPANVFNSLTPVSQLGVDLITAALTGGVTVTLVASGNGDGVIDLQTPLDINNTVGTNNLVLIAANTVQFNAPVIDSVAGGQTLNIVVSPSPTIVAANIETGGGLFTATTLSFAAPATIHATQISATDVTVSGQNVVFDGTLNATNLNVLANAQVQITDGTTLTGLNVTAGSQLTANGRPGIPGGAFVITNFALDGSATFTGGAFAIDTTLIGAGGLLIDSGPGTSTFNSLVLLGELRAGQETVNTLSIGDFRSLQPGVLNGGTLTAQTTIGLNSDLMIAGGANLVNGSGSTMSLNRQNVVAGAGSGTLTNNAALSLAFESDRIEVALINDGTVQLDSSDLQLLGGGSGHGTFRLIQSDGNSSLHFSAGTYTLLDGAQIRSDSAQFDPAVVDGGTLAANAIVAPRIDGLLFTSGFVEGPSALSIGSLFWNGGTFRNNGQATVKDAFVIDTTAAKGIDSGYQLTYDPGPGVIWSFVNTLFTDGGVITGSFRYDANTQAMLSWNINTAGGTNLGLPATTYDSTVGGNTQFRFDNQKFVFQKPDGRRQLRIAVATPFTTTGGPLSLDFSNLNRVVECVNCAPFRVIASGSLNGVKPTAQWRNGDVAINGGGGLNFISGDVNINTPTKVAITSTDGNSTLTVAAQVNVSINTSSGNDFAFGSNTDLAGVVQSSGGTGVVTLTGSALTTFSMRNAAVLRNANFVVGDGTLQAANNAAALITQAQVLLSSGKVGALAGGVLRLDQSHLDITGGAVIGAGDFLIDTTSDATVAGNFSIAGGNLVNRNVVNWTSGDLTFLAAPNPGNLRNFGVLNFVVPAEQISGVNGSITNSIAGVINMTGGVLTIGVPLNNIGVFNIDQGALTLAGGGIESGAIHVRGLGLNSSLLFAAGNFSFADGAVVDVVAPGDTITVTDAAVSLAPNSAVNFDVLALNGQGSVTVNLASQLLLGARGLTVGAGNLQLNDGASIGGAIVMTGGTITVPSAAQVSLQNLRMSGGAINDAGLVTATGLTEFLGGQLSGGGYTVGGQLNIGGATGAGPTISGTRLLVSDLATAATTSAQCTGCEINLANGATFTVRGTYNVNALGGLNIKRAGGVSSVLNIVGQLNIASALNVAAGLVNDGNINALADTTLSGGGSNNGVITANGGVVHISTAPFNLADASALVSQSTGFVVDNGGTVVVVNGATANVVGAGVGLRVVGATLNVDGTLLAATTPLLLDDGALVSGAGSVDTRGLAVIGSAAGATIGAGTALQFSAIALPGNGVLNVAGAALFDGTSSFAGSVNVLAGGVLASGRGSTANVTIASLSNSGRVELGSSAQPSADAQLHATTFSNTSGGLTIALSGTGARVLDAIFTNGGEVRADGSTFTLSAAGAIVDNGRFISLNAGNFALPNITAFDHSGTFLLSAGSLFSLPNGNFIWRAGTVDGGSLNVQQFTQLVAGTLGSALTSQMLNVGTGTNATVGNATVGAAVNNGTLTLAGTLTAASGVTNNGMLQGSGVINGAFNNTNTLDATGGLTINAGGANVQNSGAINVGAGANFVVAGANNFINTGGITLGNGATLTQNAGGFDWQSGTLSGGAFNFSGAVNVVNGGAHTLDAALSAPSLAIATGQSLIVSATGALQTGALNVQGTLTSGTSAVNVSGAASISGSAALQQLQVAGALIVTGGNLAATDINSASLRVDTAGTLVASNVTLTGDARFASGATANITNALAVSGLLDVAGGAALDLGPTATVSGAVTVGTGSRLTLHQTDLTGAVTIDGELHGTGNIIGKLTNSGLVDVGFSPGILRVTGDFVQAPDGNLRLEIGGPLPFSPGVNYDQLIISGNATFDGTLTLVEFAGFSGFDMGSLVPITYQSFTSLFAKTVVNGGPEFAPNLIFGPVGALQGVLRPPGDLAENKGDVAQDVTELADQQDDLGACDPDEKAADGGVTADQHGVGCKGI